LFPGFGRTRKADGESGGASKTPVLADPVAAAAPPPATEPAPEPTPQLPRRVSVEKPAAPASPDLYTAHFGLTARPFALAPDPEFLFWPPAHKRAYTMLEYGVMTHSPITLITGEIGAGKTTLLLQLMRSLGPEVHVGLISNPNGARSELLRWVLMALDQPAGMDESYVDLFARFQHFLIDEYAAGRRVVLIFDEAQNLGEEALEELRMFTNINSGKDELLQLVLVGQPELRDVIARPSMKQFAQRVAANYHLTAMDLRTVRAYIPHRLKVAGREDRIFATPAVDLIYKTTGGVPRLVNQLCDLSLVYAFSKGKQTVSAATVQQVLDDGVFFAVNSVPAKDDPLA
jgi:type II secretory pathway predicted ATPase ExeA